MSTKRIKTSVLNLAYEEGGPKNGLPVILLHGWPDSPRTWTGVVPHLHAVGYRTIVPYLRGYGPTSFRSFLLSRSPRRSGQAVAFAQDVIDLADALKLRRFAFVGHDWGARTAYALAALFPSRLSSITGISVPFSPGGGTKLPTLSQSRAWWYQWFLCSTPGAKQFVGDPIAFARKQWETWSPEGWFDEREFAATAESWKNEDFSEITLHAYRSRWGHAENDPRYDPLQARYVATMTLSVPALLLQGMEDACVLPETTDGAGRYFTGPYSRVLLDGVGHFPSREAPDEVAEHVVRHLQVHA